MPYNHAQLLAIKAEFLINGVWAEVTSRARAAGGVWVKHGQSPSSNGPETSRARFTIGNDDGWLTEDNGNSPWFPYVGRGTAVRLSLTGILGNDAGRFAGEVDKMVAVYPGGDSSAIEIEAIGTWGTLEQNDDPLRSALYRAITTTSPAPIAYWSFEDGIRAAAAASNIAGGQPFLGSIAFEAAQGPDGAGTVASLKDRGASSGAVQGCGTTAWRVEHVAQWRKTDSHGPSLSIEIGTTGTIDMLRYTVNDSPADVIRLTYYLTSGGLGTNVDSTAVAFDGEWKHIRLDAVQDGGDVDFILTVNGTVALSTTVAGQTMGAVVRCGITTFEDVADSDLPLLGHIAVWSGTMPTTDTAWASTGYTSELVTDRIARLSDEEAIDVTILGGSNQRMGPQRPKKITELFSDCQDVDQGRWCDSLTDIGLVYRTGSHLYTQPAQVAIIRGAITPDTKPTWDFQDIRNEWTVSRDGGSSATQSDEDHIARVRRRIKGVATIRIADDDFLADQAMWRVNLGTVPGPRYQDFGINVRNVDGARLADAILALRVGDRLTADAATFPTQHPPGGADQMALGWTEELDADFWELRPNLVPYRPYRLAGRWALLSHALKSAVDSSAASVDIATTDVNQPLLETDPALIGSGYGTTVGGEQMLITAVAASIITFGTTGTTSHANNGSVTPGLPSSLAVGDLMLMIAAIRNSGAGVPNTPAGWYRLPVVPTTSNLQVFARIATSSESGPTVSFSGGVANADCSARITRLVGKWGDVQNILIPGAFASRLNPSAQNIIVPGLPKPSADNAIVIACGWKQDDWTSVAPLTGFTEITEDFTTTGDDQGIVWDRLVQTAATSVPSLSFPVTGGGAAISRSTIFAVRCDVQTATVRRGINGTTATAHSAGDGVTMTDPFRWGLV